MVFYGQKYFVESGSYDIRKAFTRATNQDGTVESETDKLAPPRTWDLDVEKSLVRKLDLRITCVCFGMYFVQYLDRVNLSNAKILNSDSPDSITKSLGLVGDDWQWAISLVYWGILSMEVPSNFFLKKFGGRAWLSRIIITWGAVVACMAAVTNAPGLKICRFFLGVAEAGMLPGVVFYMSFWYTATERATRMAWYFAGSSIAGGVSGLIAAGMENMNGKGGLKAWQWLFLLEGIFSILYGIMANIVMLNFPESPTTILTKEEQDVAIRRLPKNAPKSSESNFDLTAFLDLLAQPAQWLFMFTYCTLNIGVFGATAFLPSVLQGLGFTSSVSANLASAWPNFATMIFYVLVSWHSDFTRERMWHYVIPMVVTCVGSAFLCGAAYDPPTETHAGFISNAARYGMCFLVYFNWSVYPIILNYRSVTLKGSTEVGMALGWMSAIAFVAALISPFMYPDEDWPEYVAAMLWGTICYVASTLTCLLIPLAIKWQNRRALVYLQNEGLLDDEMKQEAAAVGLKVDGLMEKGGQEV